MIYRREDVRQLGFSCLQDEVAGERLVLTIILDPVVDSQLGPEYDGIMLGSPIFSLDGKRVAYGALKGKKRVVVVDRQPWLEYAGV